MKRLKQIMDEPVTQGHVILTFLLTILAVWLFGCTPHAAPIDVLPERVEQRVEDLQHECERCGEPATENVSEVADEYNYRCPKCVPRNVMPKLQRKPKLERQWT